MNMKKLCALLCAFAMVIAVMPGTFVSASFEGEEWTFSAFDPETQTADQYLGAIDLALIAGSFDIENITDYGNMLKFTANDRLIKWYRPDLGYETIAEDVVFEIDFMQETKSTVPEIGTPSSDGFNAPDYTYILKTDGTDILLEHGGGTDVVVANYQAGKVYNIKIAIMLESASLRVWVDDSRVLENENLTFLGANAPTNKKIQRFDFKAGSSTFYLGKLKVTPYVDSELELAKLSDALDSANQLFAGMEVGEYLGQYTQEAIDVFADAINTAQTSYESWADAVPADATPIIMATQTLNEAAIVAKGSVNIQYSTLYEMNFDSKDIIADGWNLYMGNTVVTAIAGNKVMRAAGDSGQNRTLRVFEPALASNRVLLDFSVMQEEKAPVTAIADIKSAPYNTPNTVAVISSDGSNIKIGNDVLIENYNADEWYKITLDIDFGTGKITTFVNDSVAMGGRTVSIAGNAATAVGRWETNLAATQTSSVVYIDNINVRKSLNSEFESEADKIEATFGDTDNIINDITLPARDSGYSFTWESDNEAVIALDGKVTRSLTENETVTLTAIISKDAYSYKTSFELTVPKINYGFLIEDDFEGQSAGSNPDGWDVTQGRAAIASAEENEFVALSGTMKKEVTYADMTPDGFVTADFMQDSKSAVNKVLSLTSTSGDIFTVISDGNDLLITNGEESKVLAENYEATKWYNIRVLYDFEENLAVALVNDVKVCDIALSNTENTSSALSVYAGTSGASFNIDNIETGRIKPTDIAIEGTTDSVIRPTRGETAFDFEAIMSDSEGKMLIGEDIVWSVLNANGEVAENVEIENGTLKVKPDSEAGTHKIRAVLAIDPSVYAEKEFTVIGQRISEITIKGKKSITQQGEYIYIADIIGEYGVALPSDGAVWSVAGSGVSINQNGELSVGYGIKGSAVITVSMNDVSGSLTVSIDTPGSNSSPGFSGGSGGGSGGGSFKPGTDNKPEVKPDTDPAPAGKFTDVPDDFWAAEAIGVLSEANVINGMDDNTYAPFAQITRAQFAKLIVEVFDIEIKDMTSDFADVSPENWYYDYVTAVAHNAIITGYGDGRFGAEDNITRQDAAVMLARALEYAGNEAVDGKLEFSDKEEISDYAKDAVGKLCAMEIINGKDNNMFDPLGQMNRAEAAMVFWRILNLVEGR